MKFERQLRALSPRVVAFGVTPDTLIATPMGERAARDLKVGDMVNTRDDGPQALTDAREAFAAPAERKHYPVHIAKGAMGFGLPRAELALGQQNRVLFEHIRVPLMFGTDAVLVRARSLVMTHDNIAVECWDVPASFIHLSFAQHCIIYAHGLPVESVPHEDEGDLDYMTVRSWELRTAVA